MPNVAVVLNNIVLQSHTKLCLHKTLRAYVAEELTLPFIMVTLSANPLSETMRLAWSAIAEHSMPYTCFAPDCKATAVLMIDSEISLLPLCVMGDNIDLKN